MDMTKFNNEVFENLCKSVLPEEAYRLKVHGGMIIGPSDPQYDKMWKDTLIKKRQELVDMELAFNLNMIARKLDVHYVEEEDSE
jgi:hypothetical protein